tara:strand:+ start:418 stop:588 length:171 start_codon:yes stop_codon:yes gene_type:complete
MACGSLKGKAKKQCLAKAKKQASSRGQSRRAYNLRAPGRVRQTGPTGAARTGGGGQ